MPDVKQIQVSTTVMPQETAKTLAFDEATGFFSDEQLCNRYQLTIDQLEAVRGQSSFQALKDENQRLLQDDGSEFLLKAKEYAFEALQTLHEVAVDEERRFSGNTRVKAAEKICEFARLRTGSAAAAGGAGGPAMIINTNLALNQSPDGAMVAEASGVTVEYQADRPPPAAVEYVEEGNEDLG